MIDITMRTIKCEQDIPIANRWWQKHGDYLYFIEHNDDLIKVNWNDLVDTGFIKKIKIEYKVEDFYVSQDQIAILTIDCRFIYRK